MTAGTAPALGSKNVASTVSLTTWLPVISASRVAGFTETLGNSPFNGSAELSSLAMRLRLNMAELFRLPEVARMLGFADIREAGLHLTAAGRARAVAGIQERNRPFAGASAAFGAACDLSHYFFYLAAVGMNIFIGEPSWSE